jgi:hypothetical protein
MSTKKAMECGLCLPSKGNPAQVFDSKEDKAMCELVLKLKLSVEEANTVLETLKQVSTMFCVYQLHKCFKRLPNALQCLCDIYKLYNDLEIFASL